MAKKENLLPTRLTPRGWAVRLVGKSKPMISFGCGAIKVSESTLDETIKYLEAKDRIKEKISIFNNEISKKERQILELQTEIENLRTKRNQTDSSIKMSKAVRRLNTRVYAVRGNSLERSLRDVDATTKHIKVLKRFFNNKNK